MSTRIESQTLKLCFSRSYQQMCNRASKFGFIDLRFNGFILILYYLLINSMKLKNFWIRLFSVGYEITWKIKTRVIINFFSRNANETCPEIITLVQTLKLCLFKEHFLSTFPSTLCLLSDAIGLCVGAVG